MPEYENRVLMDLQLKNAKYEFEVRNLNSELDKIKQELVKTQHDLKTNKTKCEEAFRDNEKYETKLNQNEEEKKNYERKIEEIKSKNRKFEEDKQKYEEKISEYEKRNNKQEIEIEKLKNAGANNNSKQELQNLEMKIESLKKENDELKNTGDSELRVKYERLKSELKLLKEQGQTPQGNAVNLGNQEELNRLKKENLRLNELLNSPNENQGVKIQGDNGKFKELYEETQRKLEMEQEKSSNNSRLITECNLKFKNLELAISNSEKNNKLLLDNNKLNRETIKKLEKEKQQLIDKYNFVQIKRSIKKKLSKKFSDKLKKIKTKKNKKKKKKKQTGGKVINSINKEEFSQIFNKL